MRLRSETSKHEGHKAIEAELQVMVVTNLGNLIFTFNFFTAMSDNIDGCLWEFSAKAVSYTHLTLPTKRIV